MASEINSSGEVDALLLVNEVGALACVTLNRARAYNAINYEMRARLSEVLPKLKADPQIYAVVIESNSEKAFSAGADVREIVARAREDLAFAREAFRAEYTLNWLLDCFTKPTVSLIDGMVIGSGVGITAFGTHRIAGEKYSFSMPETAIGLFPDVGVASVLAQMPDEIGTYLGLLGARVGRADAYMLGLVTHCIGAEQFGAIKAELADAQTVDPLLDGRHEDPGEGELSRLRGTISACFGAQSVEGIVKNLKAVTGEDREWAQEVMADLATRSPLSLKVTLQHLRRAKDMDLREILPVDYRLACRFLEGHDFYEGVRAALVDKDGKPQWKPSTLEEVSDEMVEAYFEATDEDDELVLAAREITQAIKR